MKEFINKKRERTKEDDESFDKLILPNNKKSKKSETYYPKENNINIFCTNNKFDKYSNSTLQSKNDFLFEAKKNDIFKIIKNDDNKANKRENNLVKILETYIFDTIIPRKERAKSLKELTSLSLSSNKYRNSLSDYSIPEEYYPYEIGEIILNKYKVNIYIIYNFPFFR